MGDSLLQIVWRQRLLVATTLAVCLLGAAAYLMIATPRYTSSARVFVQRNGPKTIGENRPEPSPDDNFLFTQKEVVGSVPVLALAMSDPNLAGLSVMRVHDRIGFLKKNVEIEAGKKDELITVSFDAPDPAEANKVVGAVVDAYKKFSVGQRRQTASEVFNLLSADKVRGEAELNVKRKLLAEQVRNGALPPADQDPLSTTVQELGAAAQALSEARRASLDAWAAHQEVNANILSEPLKATAVEVYRKSGGAGEDPSRLRTELQQLRSRLQGLSQRYGPGHPGIEQLKKEIEQYEISYAAAVETRYELTKRIEAEARRNLDVLQKAAHEQRAKYAESASLQAEITVLQKHVEALDGRLKQVNLSEDGPHITVLEAPHTELMPTKPNRPRIMALAAAIGLLLGASFAGARDSYARRLRSAGEAERALGLPVLATIPALPMPAGGESPSGARLLEGNQPFAEVAAAYLAMRRAIPAGLPDGDRTIVVTSVAAGDGKSTVAGNLAIFLAKLGRRVLFIDADLRSTGKHSPFHVEAMNGGLADVLNGQAVADAVIQATQFDGLEVMPAGTASEDPSALLNRPQFIEVLDQLAEQYDHVLIDTPAIRAGADARIVAAASDVTLLVLRDGMTSHRSAAAARDALKMVGANVAGVILNNAAPQKTTKPPTTGMPAITDAVNGDSSANGFNGNGPSHLRATARRKAALRGPNMGELAPRA